MPSVIGVTQVRQIPIRQPCTRFTPQLSAASRIVVDPVDSVVIPLSPNSISPPSSAGSGEVPAFADAAPWAWKVSVRVWGIAAVTDSRSGPGPQAKDSRDSQSATRAVTSRPVSRPCAAESQLTSEYPGIFWSSSSSSVRTGRVDGAAFTVDVDDIGPGGFPVFLLKPAHHRHHRSDTCTRGDEHQFLRQG